MIVTEKETENKSFLEAIYTSPDCDTTRLVYADWLDEKGDSARAEFIRVQCELEKPEPSINYLATFASNELLAKMTRLERGGINRHELNAKAHPIASRRLDAFRERVHLLRARERQLLALHELEWRKGAICSCRTQDGISATRTMRCPICLGTGYSGGLTLCHPNRNPRSKNVESDRWVNQVQFRRGFPYAVHCAELGDVIRCVENIRLHILPWISAALSVHRTIHEVICDNLSPVRDESGWEWYDLPEYLNAPLAKQTFDTPELAKSALGSVLANIIRSA